MTRTPHRTSPARTLALLATALLVLSPLGAACAADEAPILVPSELAQRLASDAPPVVLDVRTDAEWNEGHIAGAIHVPVDEIEARMAEVPRDRDVVVHCAVGPRARRAEAALAGAGYDRLLHLEGGFRAWSAAGLPFEK